MKWTKKAFCWDQRFVFEPALINAMSTAQWFIQHWRHIATTHSTDPRVCVMFGICVYDVRHLRIWICGCIYMDIYFTCVLCSHVCDVWVDTYVDRTVRCTSCTLYTSDIIVLLMIRNYQIFFENKYESLIIIINYYMIWMFKHTSTYVLPSKVHLFDGTYIICLSQSIASKIGEPHKNLSFQSIKNHRHNGCRSAFFLSQLMRPFLQPPAILFILSSTRDPNMHARKWKIACSPSACELIVRLHWLYKRLWLRRNIIQTMCERCTYNMSPSSIWVYIRRDKTRETMVMFVVDEMLANSIDD